MTQRTERLADVSIEHEYRVVEYACDDEDDDEENEDDEDDEDVDEDEEVNELGTKPAQGYMI